MRMFTILREACLLIFLALGLPAAAHGQDLTLDQIIGRYVKAIGGAENIKALQNIVYRKGIYQEGNYYSDRASMSMARPFYKLVGDKSNPDEYMEGYDGSAWEYFGNPRVVIRTTGAPSAAIRHYAGVERPLFDYQKKGSRAELLGQVSFKGGDAYAIRLTRRDGYVEQLYLDKETFLVVAVSHEVPIHAFGPEVKTITRISDYRPVAGVLIPHRFETVRMPSEEPQDSMQWVEVEGNVDLPDDWFSPPAVEQTHEEKLIADLYGQRTDFTAMIWTYEEFRLGFPEVDTNAALNIAGFQILKMGHHDTAIALLERNAKDYPESAETRFGLGRAYRTAGRPEDAKAAFEKALELEPGHARSLKALEEMAEG